jgi:hypothetical protein
LFSHLLSPYWSSAQTLNLIYPDSARAIVATLYRRPRRALVSSFFAVELAKDEKKGLYVNIVQGWTNQRDLFREVPMRESRRHLITAFIGAAGVLAVEPLLAGLEAQGPGSSPKAKVYPNGRDPNQPPGLDDPSRPDPKTIRLANQKELKSDVSKLYDMVSELKDQLEKTDPASTLSLSMVKKTEQIEKLAKQIKNLAKG